MVQVSDVPVWVSEVIGLFRRRWSAVSPQHVTVPVDSLTPDQALRWLVASQQRLESAMTDLTAEVQQLQTAVAGVAGRVQDQLGQLTQAVSDAQSALQTAQANDASDQQKIDELQAALQASVQANQSAADAITPLVDQLNSLGSVSGQPTPPDQTPPDQTPPDQTPPDQTGQVPPDQTPPDQTGQVPPGGVTQTSTPGQSSV